MRAGGADAPRGGRGERVCPPASLGRHPPDGEYTAEWKHPIDTAPGKMVKGLFKAFVRVHERLHAVPITTTF